MSNKKDTKGNLNEQKLVEHPSGLKVIGREFKKDKLALFSLIFLITLFSFIFISERFVDEGEYSKVVLKKEFVYKSPDITSYEHFLGTDQAGRSVLYLLIGGARNSIIIGFAITIISNIIGVVIGLISGFYGGRVDNIIMRIIDFLSILPTLLLIMVFIIIIPDYSVWHFIAIMSAFFWRGVARLVRSQTLSEARRDYVNASKTMGTSNLKIMFWGVLPNISSIVIVNLTLALAGNIGIETGLSYLGFGLPVGTPSLGTAVAAARDTSVLTARPWVWMPASTLILTMMLSINYVGTALRRASDAKQRLG